MNKELGKIKNVYFGLGGYQDCQIGIHFTFEGKGWGCGMSKGAWDCNQIEHTKHSKWTEEDRSRDYNAIVRYVSDILEKAKVDRVDKLEGIPVEVTFDNGMLKSWRVLEEVL